ncbi:MAG TPA: MBL fold metallo-hydrolase [Acidimicrobiia bacterium]
MKTDAAEILIDPWFSPEGAFLGSWFQYPANDHLLASDLTNPDAIVISHEHLDHVDGWFLARVGLSVPVFIPKYHSPALKAKITSGGDRPLIELDEWDERVVADGITVFFVSEESPMNHDSAMVIRSAGQALVNMNDARLSPAQIRRIRTRLGGHVDGLAVQGAGASWYPICYRYPKEHKQALSVKKRRAKLKYVSRVHDLLEPDVTIPFAGPPAFLDEDLRFANAEMDEGGIFPTQDQVADWLAKQATDANPLVLLPGDSFQLGDGEVHRDATWSGFTFADRDSYLDSYAHRRRTEIAAVRARHPVPTTDLWDDFCAYFDRVLSMSSYFNERIDMNVGFEILGPGGGAWSVDFREGQQQLRRGTENCQYTYSFDSRWLPSILDGSTPWEDFFLSLRFEAWRVPDLYNDHLLGLLKFAWPDALSAVEQWERDDQASDTIDILLDGVTYRIERYCPHGRQDLRETAEILPNGILRCLGHHYEFDLATGGCVNGRSRPLESRVVSVGDRGQEMVTSESTDEQPEASNGPRASE